MADKKFIENFQIILQSIRCECKLKGLIAASRVAIESKPHYLQFSCYRRPAGLTQCHPHIRHHTVLFCRQTKHKQLAVGRNHATTSLVILGVVHQKKD